MSNTLPLVLTIAGSDPTGNAGSQADLATFAELGVRGISAVTAITATEQKQLIIHPTPADILTQQISTACNAELPQAIKIGIVGTQANIRVVNWFLKRCPSAQVVIDPILHSSSGFPLLESKAYTFYRQQLLPCARLVMPNIREAEALAGMNITSLDAMAQAAKVLYQDLAKLGGDDRKRVILIKGGHLPGDPVDVLFDGQDILNFAGKRIHHGARGTGCRFSAAVTAFLAQDMQPVQAINKARQYIIEYMKQAQATPIKNL